jgi:hypothetical protein
VRKRWMHGEGFSWREAGANARRVRGGVPRRRFRWLLSCRPRSGGYTSMQLRRWMPCWMAGSETQLRTATASLYTRFEGL